MKSVKGRGESRYSGREQDTAGTQDSVSLGEGLSADFLLHEMVERTQQQDSVRGLAVEWECECVADFG
jgi:hypothetical protein